jgi:hypothetical protein
MLGWCVQVVDVDWMADACLLWAVLGLLALSMLT